MRPVLAALAVMIGLSSSAQAADPLFSLGVEYGHPLGFAAEGRLTSFNDRALNFEAGLHLGTNGGKLTLGTTHIDNHIGMLAFRLAALRTWNQAGPDRTWFGVEAGYSLLYFVSADVGVHFPTSGRSRGPVFSWSIGIGLPILPMWSLKKT